MKFLTKRGVIISTCLFAGVIDYTDHSYFLSLLVGQQRPGHWGQPEFGTK